MPEDTCLHGARITKTCLYNFDSLTPHFYIVKLRFTGVYIFFLIFLENINCEFSLESHRHNLCFEQIYEKYQSFLSKNFQFLEVKFSVYFTYEYACFPNAAHILIFSYFCRKNILCSCYSLEAHPRDVSYEYTQHVFLDIYFGPVHF